MVDMTLYKNVETKCYKFLFCKQTDMYFSVLPVESTFL